MKTRSESGSALPLEEIAESNKSIATPEGDNEGIPSQPLSSSEPTPIRPPGDQPHSVEPLRDALGSKES